MDIITKHQASTIAEMTGGIILASFKKNLEFRESSYQSEAELEKNLIENLISQGYERLNIKTNDELYANLKTQLEKLNDVSFTEKEWNRFLIEYLDAPNEGLVEKTRKVQENHIYDFIFDDGHLKNIKILDKKNIHNNFLQVVNQVNSSGSYRNRYDVTILVNGLPLIHIELKKEVLIFKKPLIKFIAIVKKVLIVKIHYIDMFKSL